MTFFGSADLPCAYPSLYLNDQRKALLDKMSNPEMRETLKDYMLNTAFRKDVFVRGAHQISSLRQSELLSEVGLALTVPRSKISLKMKLPIGEVSGKAELYEPVIDALMVPTDFGRIT
jgi:hypothetical protein